MLRHKPGSVDFLVLGAGWTSIFLVPLLKKEGITHAETTRNGRDRSIPFQFDPDSEDLDPYKRLPSAETVLITFPLTGHGQATRLCELYRQTHGDQNRWIQLGSSGIFNQVQDWNDENSKYDEENARAIAEDELRCFVGGCVLNLAGLYGGGRNPENWLGRVAKSKDEVRAKKSVHFIHGEDLARAIVAVHRNFTAGKRWLIADTRVYDWWDLILSFSGLKEKDEERKDGDPDYGAWVGELMLEEGIRALPRDTSSLGRKLDTREFWKAMGIWPKHQRLA